MKIVVDTSSKTFKIFFGIVILIGAFVLFRSYAEKNKWILAEETESGFFYLDKSSITMTDKNKIEFVSKEEPNNGKEPIIVKFYVTMGQLSNYKSARYNTKYNRYNKKSDSRFVKPDTLQEKLINKALAFRGKKPIYGTTKHKWIPSFELDGKPISMCLDTGSYDKEKKEGFIFLQNVNDRGKILKTFHAFILIEDKVIMTNDKAYQAKPGSIEEAIIKNAQFVFSNLSSNKN